MKKTLGCLIIPKNVSNRYIQLIFSPVIKDCWMILSKKIMKKIRWWLETVIASWLTVYQCLYFLSLRTPHVIHLLFDNIAKWTISRNQNVQISISYGDRIPWGHIMHPAYNELKCFLLIHFLLIKMWMGNGYFWKFSYPFIFLKPMYTVTNLLCTHTSLKVLAHGGDGYVWTNEDDAQANELVNSRFKSRFARFFFMYSHRLLLLR